MLPLPACRAAIAGLALAALACAPARPGGDPAGLVPGPAAASPPNLLVVLSDDHRWDALGAAGNPNVRTPVMDALARDGVFFRQATVSVSQCHPVRASLLTGLPAFRHGVYSIQHQAPGVAETLCERATVPGLLRAAGYRTVVVGKWHVPPPPWACGFADVRTWLPDGGTHFHDPLLVRGVAEEPETVPGFTQEIFADDAVAFLEGEAARQGPFLLWLGFTAPHFPYEPNPEHIQALYAGRRAEELPPPGFDPELAAGDPRWRHYDEAVSHLDEQLGRVLAALADGGLAERTVVLLMGDNGYLMGEHGAGGPDSRAAGKVLPWEGSLRVPLLVRGPGLPSGQVSDLPVSSLDLPPTLLALAGVPVPADWPGRDLRAALAGELAVTEAFAEWSDEESERFGHLAFRAVRTPTHKLVLWKDPERGEELYDLVADPGETRDLAGDPAAEPALADLRARLAGWMERTGDPARSWPAAVP